MSLLFYWVKKPSSPNESLRAQAWDSTLKSDSFVNQISIAVFVNRRLTKHIKRLIFQAFLSNISTNDLFHVRQRFTVVFYVKLSVCQRSPRRSVIHSQSGPFGHNVTLYVTMKFFNRGQGSQPLKAHLSKTFLQWITISRWHKRAQEDICHVSSLDLYICHLVVAQHTNEKRIKHWILAYHK